MFKQEFDAVEQAWLAQVKTYEEMSRLAMHQMRRLCHHSYTEKYYDWVCGPMTTGGLGSLEANFGRFNEVTAELRRVGHRVFSQMPYEDRMAELWDTLKPVDGYDYRLLEGFYTPIFESGMIRRFHFIPGWEDSTGSRWEHDLAEKLGTEISYLGHDLLPLR